MLVHLCIGDGCFCTQRAEVTPCHTDCVAFGVQNGDSGALPERPWDRAGLLHRKHTHLKVQTLGCVVN